MTIQQPPNDESPPLPETDPTPGPRDEVEQAPEQRAPGLDQAPLGAPRDEPDPELG